MNKSSHILIGRLLCRRLSDRYGIFLDPESFLFGSILPDICPSFLLRPHILQNHRRHIRKAIEGILAYDKQASAFFGRSFSLELGILCHYFADFLCYAHSSGYSGDIAAHVKYEKDLYRVLSGVSLDGLECGYVLCPPGEITADFVLKRFMEVHENHAQTPPSFYNDISQCIRACTEALVLLTGAVLVAEPDEGELLFPA